MPSVYHGGINDVKRHCQSRGHVNRYSGCQSNSTMSSFVTTTNPSHQSKVIAAEVVMSKFIALHNLPFQAADHLTDLFPFMFPDSKIANSFSSKHTKTKSILCDALDPYYIKSRLPELLLLISCVMNPTKQVMITSF